MKIKIITYVALTALFVLSSCSSDYLDTDSKEETSPEVVFATTENAKMAVNGIARLMTQQFLGTQGFNGEGTIKLYYGEFQGDAMSIVSKTSSSSQVQMKNNNNNTAQLNYYPWFYYYTLINNANLIIKHIDGAKGPQQDRESIKAQAFTYRAYSYLMLAQIYANRWVDSNNGTSQGVVLRVTPGGANLKLSTLAQTFELIYDDLKQAIELFERSEFERKKEQFFVLNKEIAHGIFARAALVKQDFVTAQLQANLARVTAQYPLMDNKTYTSGFNTPTSEWLWGSYSAIDQTLYSYGYFAYMGYNSSSSAVRNYPKRINKRLYEQIALTDIRRTLFLDDNGLPYNTTTGQASSKSELYKKAFKDFPDLDDKALVFDHMQFKIKTQSNPGIGNLVHMRSSELLLMEAEAAFFNNDQATTRELLRELNKQRDPNFSTNLSGQALLEQLKFYRAIELWAEGFNWFDLKRWNDPLIREGFSTGGNYALDFAGDMEPGAANRWTYVIPSKETDFNDAI